MRILSLFFLITLGLNPLLTGCAGGGRKRPRPEHSILEPHALETWVQLVGSEGHLGVVYSPVVVFTGQHQKLTVEIDGKEPVLFSRTENFVLKSNGRAMVICAQPKRQRMDNVFSSGWKRVQDLLSTDNEQRGADCLLLAACIEAKTPQARERLLKMPTFASEAPSCD